jgi:hypothetical protein
MGIGIERLTSHSNVTHYSYFGAFRSSVSNIGPNAAMLDASGKRTDIGSWYMGGVATNNIPQSSGASRTVPSIFRYLTAALFPGRVAAAPVPYSSEHAWSMHVVGALMMAFLV